MQRTVALLVFGLVGAGLAYQVLVRIPTDALNVALGVACGIGASIPVSIGLLVALTRRNREQGDVEEWQEPQSHPVQPAPAYATRYPQPATLPQQPQIIVIAPPQGQLSPGQFGALQTPWGYAPAPLAPDGDQTVDARDWRIIGEE